MEVGALLERGGPWAIIAALVSIILKSYIENRKESREDRKTERQSESEIVETTRAALGIVREQMVDISVELKDLKTDKRHLEGEMRRLIESHHKEVEDLRGRVFELEQERDSLRRRVSELEER